MLSSALNFLTDKRRKFLRAETVAVFDPEQINFTVPSQLGNPEHVREPSVKNDSLGADEESKVITTGDPLDGAATSSSTPEKNSQKHRREVYSRAKKRRENSHTISGWIVKTNSFSEESRTLEMCDLHHLKLPSREDFMTYSSARKGGDKLSYSSSFDSVDKHTSSTTTTTSPNDTCPGLDKPVFLAFTNDSTPTDQLKSSLRQEQLLNCEATANTFFLERYQTANQKRNTGTSHGRIARMRVKAAVRAAEKARHLHRSQSSAQIHEENQPSPVPVGGHVRSSSGQRECSNKAKTGTNTDNLAVPSNRKPRSEKRSKTGLERTSPRSRSAASHLQDPKHSKGRHGTHVYLNHHDMLAKGLLLGTSVMPQKIHPSECARNQTRNLNSSWQVDGETPKLVAAGEYTRSSEQNLDPAHQHSKTLLAQSVEPNHLKFSDNPSKRRLRRNNSSNYNDRGSSVGVHGNRANIYPTVFTAGDLMLPSNILFMKQTQQNCQKSESDMLVDEILELIEHDSLLHLVERITGCEPNLHKLSVANGLSFLDCACLLSSPEVIAFFIMHNFEPGSWLKTTMDKGPTPSRLRDPIKFHLTRKIAEADDNLKLAKAITQATVNHANELKVGVLNLTCGAEETNELNDALVEVERAEVNLAECNRIKNHFLKLFDGLERFPSTSWPPAKVNLVVSGNNSIIVRVSQPRGHNFVMDQEISEFEYSDLSSDENTYCKPLCDGRHFAEKSHLQFSKLTLCYRIEWSICKDFTEDGLQYCIVKPPFRPVHSHDRSDIGRLHKTGFYELCELASDVEVFVRVFAFSIRGWSEACYSQPVSLAPSAWFTYNRFGSDQDRQTNTEDLLEQRLPFRYIGNELETELTQAKLLVDRFLLNWHVKQAPESSHLNIDGGNDDGIVAKRSKSPILQRKRSFRFLFPNKTVKFGKQTKSGVYMALLCYASNPVNDLHVNISSSQSASTPLNYGDIKENFQLVVADDGSLPMLNVTKEDVTAHGSFYMDINWMARLLSSSNNGTEIQLISEQFSHKPVPVNLQFRISLLTALQRLQSSLGNSDVGQLHPEIFEAKVVESVKKQSSIDNYNNGETNVTEGWSNDDISDGGLNTKIETPVEPLERPQNTSCILLLIKPLRDVKAANLSSGLKWCTMQKFFRQHKVTLEPNVRHENGQSVSADTIKDATNGRSADGAAGTASGYRGDQLILTPEAHLVSRLENLLWYSERRGRRLQPGLYVAFVQMQASLDQQPTILGYTSQDVVNMLPVERVRQRSHVTFTEWALLHALAQPCQRTPPGLSKAVEDIRFLRKLHSACSRLSIRISTPGTEPVDLRLYLPEVIQISLKHAFILTFPPADQVCLPPLQKTPIPMNCYWQPMSHFERNLSSTYDPIYFSRISNLTAILEVLVPMSLFLQRQCFTDTELTQCIHRTNALQSLQRDLDATYQSNRWLGTAISTARDRKRPVGWSLYCSILSAFLRDLSTEKASRQRPTPFSGTKDIPAGDKLCDTDYAEERGMAILQVYASYSSELPTGTSVRLLMSMSTTSDEVVALVVKRLAEVVARQRECRGKRRELSWDPSGDDDTNKEHCLTVSLVSGLEYFLPGHFRPLLLRQPWRNGRFAISKVDKGQIRKTSRPVMLRGEIVHPIEKVKYTEPIRINSLHITTVANPFVRVRVCRAPVVQYLAAEDEVDRENVSIIH